MLIITVYRLYSPQTRLISVLNQHKQHQYCRIAHSEMSTSHFCWTQNILIIKIASKLKYCEKSLAHSTNITIQWSNTCCKWYKTLNFSVFAPHHKAEMDYGSLYWTITYQINSVNIHFWFLRRKLLIKKFLINVTDQ